MVKVLPHIMRNINEFNIPAGNEYGYEILYFGVNLILMFEYKLSFSIKVRESAFDDSNNTIDVLILSRKDVLSWKKGSNVSNMDIELHYSNNGENINDIFRPSISDAYAFILSNRINNKLTKKVVDVTLIHSWKQEIKESHPKNIP
jgi:hypothetical protein